MLSAKKTSGHDLETKLVMVRQSRHTSALYY